MKFEATERFLADYRRLQRRERALFAESVRALNDAWRRAGARWPPTWPGALRIGSLQGAPGIFELTWSFARPDGRATFELVEIDGEPGIRWRRIGGHAIFHEP